MAKWWELAIPVVGTLAGAGLGTVGQLWSRRHQSRHEREMRVLDEKLAQYAVLATLLPEWSEAARSAEEALRAAGPYSDLQGEDRLNPEMLRRGIELLKASTEAQMRQVAIMHRVNGLLGPLMLYSPEPVRSACRELSLAIMQGSGDYQGLRSRLDYEMRKDIGVEKAGRWWLRNRWGSFRH